MPALLVLWQDITLDSEKKMLLGMFNGILESRLQHVKPLSRVDGHYLPGDNDLSYSESPKARSQEALKGSFARFRDDIASIYLGLVPGVQTLDGKNDEKDSAVAAVAIRGKPLYGHWQRKS